MRDVEFKIEGEYIGLIKLLKATHVTLSGGEAKLLVESGTILRNGEVELRKRAKIVANERIEIRDRANIKTI